MTEQGNPLTTTGSTSTTTTTSSSCGSSQTYYGQSSPPSGDYVRINESNLNIRTQPGTNHCSLGQVVRDNYYPLSEVRGNWALISGSHGSGWVHTGYVTIFRGPSLPEISPVGIPLELIPSLEYLRGVLDVDEELIISRLYHATDYMQGCGVLLAVAIDSIRVGITSSRSGGWQFGAGSGLAHLSVNSPDAVYSCAETVFEDLFEWFDQND